MTKPPGFSDLACFRMVDMFTACTRMDLKKSILCSFVQPTHYLRIIIATVAFGMGINTRTVIDWAPPDDLRKKLEELGEMATQHLLSCIIMMQIFQEHMLLNR